MYNVHDMLIQAMTTAELQTTQKCQSEAYKKRLRQLNWLTCINWARCTLFVNKLLLVNFHWDTRRPKQDRQIQKHKDKPQS